MKRILLSAVLVLLSCSNLPDAFGRKWTDRTGQFSVEAELVEVRDGKAVLRRADGGSISVPIDQLSDTDRKFLASQQPAKRSDAAITLVKDGQATSVIVTNGRPKESQDLAANELQEHIRIMSGVTVPIVKENEFQPDDSRALILIGASNLAGRHGVDPKNWEPETFVVKTSRNDLLLVGEDGGSKSNARTGTLWAVYDFLQDQLGCRWIWPGEIGRFVPRRATVAVGELDVRETPVVKVRTIRMTCQVKHRVAYEKEGLGRFLTFGDTYNRVSEDERTWLRRMRMGRSFKLSYGHAFTDWWEKHKDSDPDIFALQADGQRRPRKSSQPDFVKMCVSNPKLWDLQLAPLREYAQQGATGLWVNACENDGSGGFCLCRRCRAWDADPNVESAPAPAVEDGSDVDTQGANSELPECLSDRYARWYNELATRAREADPESRVIAYAYSRYRSPPAKIQRIEPNVWIGYVGFNAYPRSSDYRRMSVDEWFGWSRRGATVFLRSNSLFYFGEGAPMVASRQMAEDLRFQVDNGLRATDFDCLQGNWATAGPSYYVLARMLWDAGADLDQILDEYYETFGPMKQVVKEYFDYWEEFTVRLGNDPAFFDLRRPDRMKAYPSLYTGKVMADARAILEKAKPLFAAASEDAQERFRNIELGLEHGDLLVRALGDGKTSNGAEGEKLMAFRNEIAHRNVVNVYWTTSKEMRYRVFD